MNGILVDTSAYSALCHDHPGVVRAIAEAERVYLSSIVLGELLAGFQKGTKYESNKKMLDNFLDRERVDTLAVDENTAPRYAVILDALRRNGTPISTNDVWVAASAMQHGLGVLTLDRDFLRIPQIIVNCFDPA